MPYTHVFATHAMLQEYLVEAIIREAKIPEDQVLVIRMRKSFRQQEDKPYRVIDGDQFNTTNGRNIVGHRLANRQRYQDFKKEVLQQLEPSFQMYSPMYTFWYLNVLADRATEYHVLEDGFASYLPLPEILKYINLTQPFTGRKKLQRQLVMEPLQRKMAPLGKDLLDQADKFYVTSRLGFPWLEAKRQVVLPSVFPSFAPGEYVDAVVWGPGCLVEAGYLSLSAYLGLIRTVMQKLVNRGVTTLHYKFHPTQVAHPKHYQAYQEVVASFSDQLALVPLDQSVSVECLAEGNKITLITGFSTLSFHVAAAGGTVITYLEDIKPLAPGVGERLGVAGRAIFDRISQPL